MRKIFRHGSQLLIVLAVLMFMAVVFASAADAANWKAKYERFSAVAGETLATGDVVCIKASDGYAYKADANDSNLRPAVGVIGKGGSSGATVEVVTRGVITGMTALSPGARLFLSETPGGYVTTAPTNAQVVGWVMPGTAGAATSTTYFINPVIPESEGAHY